MRFTQPHVTIDGDSDDRIMARSGSLVGFDPETGLCVWRFGFLLNSQAARTYGVSVRLFTWVLCGRDGVGNGMLVGVSDIYNGFGTDLPKEYSAVILADEPVDEREADPYDV